MITKRIYVCENSIEGIFTGIYDAWDSRYGHDNIGIKAKKSENEEYNFELFAEYINVVTDPEKAVKVARSIHNKISEEAFDMVCHAAWSDSLEKGDYIYRFLILGFAVGADVVNHMGNEIVMNIFELNRTVGNEAHHYLGFLRFTESSGNILLAKIKPQNDILRIIAPHFSDRLSEENFIIYDENRKTAIVHSRGYPWVYTMAESLNLNKFIEYSEKEEEFQALWKTFFDSIAINERKNKKLQQNNMPGRFRSNMTEFRK